MLEQAIKELLAADSAITGLCVDRIRPMLGSQLDVRPFLVFTVIAGEPIGHFRGTSVYKKSSVEIGIYADSYLEAVSLGDNVRRVLDGIAANTTNERIAPSRFDEQSDIEQVSPPGAESPVYLRTQTYRVTHRAI